MRIEEYPPQEPLSSDAARAYHAEVLRRGEGVAMEEIAYASDPYQRLAIARPAPVERPAPFSPSCMAAAGPAAIKSG